MTDDETVRTQVQRVVREARETVDDDRLVTVAEVAAATTIAESTLYTWRTQKTGPKSFCLGRRIVYRWSDVVAWLAAQEAATSRGGAS